MGRSPRPGSRRWQAERDGLVSAPPGLVACAYDRAHALVPVHIPGTPNGTRHARLRAALLRALGCRRIGRAATGNEGWWVPLPVASAYNLASTRLQFIPSESGGLARRDCEGLAWRAAVRVSTDATYLDALQAAFALGGPTGLRDMLDVFPLHDAEIAWADRARVG